VLIESRETSRAEGNRDASFARRKVGLGSVYRVSSSRRRCDREAQQDGLNGGSTSSGKRIELGDRALHPRAVYSTVDAPLSGHVRHQFIWLPRSLTSLVPSPRSVHPQPRECPVNSFFLRHRPAHFPASFPASDGGSKGGSNGGDPLESAA